MKRKLLSAWVAAMVFFFFFSSIAIKAYWNKYNIANFAAQLNFHIGEFTFEYVEIFNPNNDYKVGDIFVYDNKIFEVVGSWFDPKTFILPDGSLNYSQLKPYGPIQEKTDEYRPYNTYHKGDVVIHNGIWYMALHSGSGGIEPGTDQWAWIPIER